MTNHDPTLSDRLVVVVRPRNDLERADPEVGKEDGSERGRNHRLVPRGHEAP